jgi:hypothetical protein
MQIRRSCNITCMDSCLPSFYGPINTAAFSFFQIICLGTQETLVTILRSAEGMLCM